MEKVDIAVSVIVPIYNVEKYLSKCVDSILNQTLSNIEIILVDDGSPDKCGEMADEFALKDSRIKVVHQNNQGLGPARNSGIQIATGEYVGFVDSDDFVGPQMFEDLYNLAKTGNYDIVVGGNIEFSNNKEMKCTHPLAGKIFTDKNEILNLRKKFYGHLQSIDGNVYYPVSSWRSIFKRDLIVKNNLKFYEVLSEDIIFDLDFYAVANSVAYSCGTNYYYRKDGQASITHSFSEKKLNRYVDFIRLLKSKVELENDEECLLRFKCQCAARCRGYASLVNISGEKFKKRKYYFKNLLENPLIADCLKDSNIKLLPIKQRVFHWLVLHKFYGVALALSKIYK